MMSSSRSRPRPANQPHRRLDPSVWTAAGHLSARTKLLIAAFTANLSSLDPLNALPDAQLADLAGIHTRNWPLARAVTARFLAAPNPTLRSALATLGPHAPVDVPRNATPLRTDELRAILAELERYPTAWVVAAERWCSRERDERTLEQVALGESWIPKVPRL
jgi:hypothetical protein